MTAMEESRANLYSLANTVETKENSDNSSESSGHSNNEVNEISAEEYRKIQRKIGCHTRTIFEAFYLLFMKISE